VNKAIARLSKVSALEFQRGSGPTGSCREQSQETTVSCDVFWSLSWVGAGVGLLERSRSGGEERHVRLALK
jgi:hypothetical protein